MTSESNPNVVTLKTEFRTPAMTATITSKLPEPIDFATHSARILANRQKEASQNQLIPWDIVPMMMFCFASYQSMFWQSIANSYASTPKRLEA